MKISKRAINTLKAMADLSMDSDCHLYFFLTKDAETVEADFWSLKEQGKLKGAWQGTLNDILELHKLLNEIWG